MKIIHVLRKPLSESTVAANTLKHGTGGLNIDATRVAHGSDVNLDAVQRQQSAGSGSVGNHFGAGSLVGTVIPTYSPVGRWPANVILQHLDGCRCEGVKRVKPSNGSGRAGVGSSGFQTSYVGRDSKGSGFTGGSVKDDGKETVANWICEPGCPVARLDEQSGVTTSTGGRTGNKDGGNIYGGGKGLAGAYSSDDPGFGDTGGASRFYKQVGGKRVE
jgi:hypothetical protein